MNFKPVLHQVHVFREQERRKVIVNNLAIDWKKGYHEIVKKVLEIHPEWQEDFKEAQKRSLEELKKNSLLLLVIFTSGICDADCEICYTDRKESKDELKLNELKKVVEESSELGVKTVYIPGEGEPFQAPYFLELMEYICKDKALNLVVFTNGILLSDKEKFQRKWGINLNYFIENYVKPFNIYFYIKLWHIFPEKVCKLMGIKEINLVPYRLIKNKGKEETIYIPAFLKTLISDESLVNKAGIETAVFKENFDIVFEYLAPFVKQTGIKWYLEPILHGGRYFGRHDLDLDENQLNKISFNKQQCQRALYTATINSRGYVIFCPVFSHILESFLGKRIEVKNKLLRNIREKKLFEILHNDEFLLKQRYGSLFHSCLCEYFSSILEREKVRNEDTIKSVKIIKGGELL